MKRKTTAGAAAVLVISAALFFGLPGADKVEIVVVTESNASGGEGLLAYYQGASFDDLSRAWKRQIETGRDIRFYAISIDSVAVSLRDADLADLATGEYLDPLVGGEGADGPYSSPVSRLAFSPYKLPWAPTGWSLGRIITEGERLDPAKEYAGRFGPMRTTLLGQARLEDAHSRYRGRR